MNPLVDKTIHRTGHPDCPACQEKRMHKPAEWSEYHPDAGKGRFADTATINRPKTK